MSTSVTFNGTSYSIPASGETGWSSLSSFLIDVANNAQTLAAQKGAIRIATSTPITISSTDYTVLSNLTVPGVVAVTLPVGVDKTIYVIGDTKGDAQTNNITISPNSGNINGSATYVIKNNYGVVALQYSTAATEWKVIGRYFTKVDAANELFGLLGAANGGTGVANNAASTLTISGNFATTLTVTAGTSVTLPTTGTLATLAGTEVLTNKTLTGNIAVTLVSGAATITLPTTTATLATLGLAETITGVKTFGAAGNVGKLAVAGTTSGSTVLNATAVASGTLTLPAATDTLVGKATTDTLTNKTLSGNTAVTLISGSGTLTLNTTGTVTLPNATDTLVGKATTDVLTNKTLSGNTAVTLISGSGTLTLNTTGTMTLPNATDTVVGKATTDTLTNKTLTGNIAVTLVSGAATVTLPTTTSTLATLGLAETFTGVKTFGSTGSVSKLAIAGTTSGSTVLDATGVASGTLTLPAATDTLVGKATTDTLTNKTLTSPALSSPTVTTFLQMSAAAETRYYNAGGTHYVGFKGPNSLADKIWTLPLVDGSANQILATDGSGTLQWATGLSSSLNQYNISVGDSTNTATSTDTSKLGDIQGSVVSATVTMTIAAPGVVSYTSHGLVTGDKVYLTTTGALPTGLTASTTYFVIKIDANSFNLATTRANAFIGTKITTSGSQSGTHTLVSGGLKLTASCFPTSMIVSGTSSGLGSTATRVVRFTVNTITGSGISTTGNDATNGTKYTILEDGVYSMHFHYFLSGDTHFGIGKNASVTTTPLSLTPGTDIFGVVTATTNNYRYSTSMTLRLAAGDVITPHTSGAAPSDVTTNMFVITQICRTS